MSRSEFLNILAQSITHLPKEEQDEILYDYEEHFRIGLEQGKTEDEIAASLGNPHIIASQFGPAPAPIEKSMKSFVGKALLVTFAIMCVVSVFFAVYRNNVRSTSGNPSEPQKSLTVSGSDVQESKVTPGPNTHNSQTQSQQAKSNSITNSKYPIDSEKTASLDNITLLNVKTPLASVNFIPVDVREIKVHLYGSLSTNNNFTPELEVNTANNQLTIATTTAPPDTSYSFTSIKMDIYIPKTYSQSIQANVSFGSIEVSDLKLDTLNCKSDAGSVSIRNITCRDITAETAAGSVNLDSVSANVKAKSEAGSVNISYKNFNNNLFAETKLGSIKLKLPENAEFALDAKTTMGRISNSFPLTSSSANKGTSIEGVVKSNRNQITLNAVMGSIDIGK